jgi:hypothetical protein
VIDLFKRDYAGLGVGVKVHLLTVLDAFAFPAAVIGSSWVENLLDYLLGRHPVRTRLVGLSQVSARD